LHPLETKEGEREEKKEHKENSSILLPLCWRENRLKRAAEMHGMRPLANLHPLSTKERENWTRVKLEKKEIRKSSQLDKEMSYRFLS
jgi:hypothetical protein